MIRAVFFDIGNVLLWFSHERMCRRLAEVVALQPAQVRQLIFDSGFSSLYDRGEVSTEELLARLETTSRKRFAVEAARRAAADIFVPNQGTVSVVEDLRGAGVYLGVISNTCELHVEHVLSTFPVFGLFDGLVLSCELGAAKPEPAVFHAALEAAGRPPQECFFTDDKPEYVAAARHLGLDGKTFRGASHLRRDLRHRGLDV